MTLLFFILVGITSQTAEDAEQVTKGAVERAFLATPDEYATAGVDSIFKGLSPPSVVTVEDVRELPGLSLTASQIKTDVELRLRSLGIPIKESKGNFAYLHFRVSVGTIEQGERTLGYYNSINVSYRDLVLLQSGYVAIANVWDRGSSGVCDKDGAAHAIRDRVRDQVDVFANAWLKTHPKEPVNPQPTGKLQPSKPAP